MDGHNRLMNAGQACGEADLGYKHWVPVHGLGSFLLTLALLGLMNPVLADTQAVAQSAKARPKICVVLSGGGARGAAHVGVLKVLEEYRVPIDC
ncbi:MAG TPA: hypothetical protein VFX11_06580, partial [Candidatus Kapabacteria bacterium]|nr:hypothetical protein [Candidatus Kapabacteria bacterium]